MCRKLPDGTYKYCPSRQPRGTTRRSHVSDAYTTHRDGTISHKNDLDPAAIADGFTIVAHTNAVMTSETRSLITQKAVSTNWTATQKKTLWNNLAAGKSVSTALILMDETGWINQFPELAATRGIQQDPRWHPEGDVFTHSGLAGDHMIGQCETANITGDERTLLVMAATFHDLGKVTHTHHHPDGRISSYGHDAAGIAPAHRLLASMDAPEEFHAMIEPLIKEHMCITSGPNPDRRIVDRLQRRLGPVSIEQWAMVVNADHGGRGTASTNGYANPWVEIAHQIPVKVQPKIRLVTGKDLIDAGLTPNPNFSKFLSEAYTAEQAGLINDRTSAREWIQQKIDSNQFSD